jgi:hypothetical protein
MVNEDHNIFIGLEERNEGGEKERVTNDKPTTSRHHASFHLEKETVKNNMR